MLSAVYIVEKCVQCVVLSAVCVSVRICAQSLEVAPGWKAGDTIGDFHMGATVGDFNMGATIGSSPNKLTWNIFKYPN